MLQGMQYYFVNEKLQRQWIRKIQHKIFNTCASEMSLFEREVTSRVCSTFLDVDDWCFPGLKCKSKPWILRATRLPPFPWLGFNPTLFASLLLVILKRHKSPNNRNNARHKTLKNFNQQMCYICRKRCLSCDCQKQAVVDYLLSAAWQ